MTETKLARAPRSSLTLVTAVVASSAFALSGCSLLPGHASNDGPPRATGGDPSVIAQVDCGEDGVANVHLDYGDIHDQILVGRPALTQAAGGQKKFDMTYANNRRDDETLSISVEPTMGTCTTTLTDDESGDVLAEKTSAGTTKLSAVVPGDPDATSSASPTAQTYEATAVEAAASSDPTADAEFLAQINDPFWVPGSSDAELVDLGRLICSKLDSGVTKHEALTAMLDGNDDINAQTEMLYAAITSYCPTHQAEPAG